MAKDRVEQDELDNDPPDRIESLYHECDEVEELGPESMKRKDGTYTGNPTLEGYIKRTEQFEIISDFRRDKE
jgi:hypothetical protein